VTALEVVALLVVAGGATAVVAARDPLRQALVSGVYGTTLGILFLVFHAPDVALSALVVTVLGLPAMTLFALARIRAAERDR
jgi:energy-converting hydrogenase B subunit D